MAKVTKFELAERKCKIAGLHLQGLANFEIARLVSVSPSQVCRDLKSISKEWRAQRISDINEVKERELLKLDLIEKKSWAAWERSCQVKTKKSAKKKGLTGKSGQILGIDSKEQTFTEEQMIGDPRHLATILDCIAKRAKIVGYEAAQKIALKFEDMSDGQLNIFQQKLMELSLQAETLKGE